MVHSSRCRNSSSELRRRLESLCCRFHLLLLVVLFYCATKIDLASSGDVPDFSKIPTPPSFIHEPNEPIIYYWFNHQTRNGNGQSVASSSGVAPIVLSCEASGLPEPRCYWKKDGKSFNPDEQTGKITPQAGVGTIMINSLNKTDQGSYQCFCSNNNGTIIDRPVELKLAYLDYFVTKTVDYVKVPHGKPYSRRCTPPKSEPPARVSWIFKELNAGAGEPKFYSINDSNIVLTDTGDVLIQYVTGKEVPPGLFFTCTAANTALQDYKFGEQFTIDIENRADRQRPTTPPAAQHISPKYITALKGKSFELYCVYTGNPPVIPHWRKLDGPLDMKRVTFGMNYNKSIKIDYVQNEDAGRYECYFPEMDPRVDNKRRVFEVDVHAAPYFVDVGPKNTNSSIGETVHFDCTVYAKPAANYTFYKNGELLTPSSRISINGPILTIHSIRNNSRPDSKDGDNGVYQCNATNEYGYVWSNFFLNVLSIRPHLMVYPPERVVAVKGGNVTLSCKFFGSPMPKTSWDAIGLPGSVAVTADLPDGTAQLNLTSVSWHHKGKFTCVARNPHGTAQCEIYLDLIEATTFVKSPVSVLVLRSQQVLLECWATHDPRLNVTYQWLKEGINIGYDNSRYRILQDNSLLIENTQFVDAGLFTCRAMTKYDSVEQNAWVNVTDVPLPPQAINIECHLSSASVRVIYTYPQRSGEEFEIQYNAFGNETDHWETYKTKLQSSANAIIPLHSYGNFTFRVYTQNSVGRSVPLMSNKICTTPAAKPATNPSNVHAAGSTSGDCTIYWNPVDIRDRNGPNFVYYVTYNASGRPGDQVKITQPDLNHVVLDADYPYQRFCATVRSKNDVGFAEPHPSPYCGYSKETPPQLAPVGFQKSNFDEPTYAEFSWQNHSDIEQVNGSRIGYKIEHWHEMPDGSKSPRKIALFDFNAFRGYVYGLKANAKNFARMMVYNGAGDGPASPTLEFQTPEGIPDHVEVLHVFALDDDRVGAVWNTPKEINGDFKTYSATLCELQNNTETKCIQRNTTNTFIDFGNLLPNTTYRMSVAAHTGAGRGDVLEQDVATSTRLEFTSAAQPRVSYQAIGDDFLNVTWLPGASNLEAKQSVGSEHYFMYRPKGSQEWKSVYPVDRAFTVKIGNLSPGTSYEVHSVSVVTLPNKLKNESWSERLVLQTTGGGASATISSLILVMIILGAVIFLIIVLIIVCLVVKNRGAKYPVSEKEREQGREPMLKEEKGFGEYARPDVDEEKRSLTAESKPESETDSMAEYGDGETGRFTEDGSFIGQYGAPNKVITAPGSAGDRGRSNLSTFV